MAHYVVSTGDEQQAMLKEIGVSSFEQLFEKAGVRRQYEAELALPLGVTEFEAYEELKTLADENHRFKTMFCGAGAYRHYIPSVVKHLAAREEFVTAYTPYQAEVSQGILQAIFEYQTMICELTGMDGANASVYDGATAAAEAVKMCVDKDRRTVLIYDTVHPETLKVIQTYYRYDHITINVLPSKNGRCDFDVLQNALSDKTACVVIQTPNYFGCLEDVRACKDKIKDVRLIVIANPISLGLLKAPGDLGADIVVGEGQPLGLPLSFGGPYLGFMAAKEGLIRKLPGRIVGETTDSANRRAFTLTLQAREQHIRREKALSSICSNQAHCALISTLYLSALGPQGISDVAQTCFQLAHYLQDELDKIGFTRPHDAAFFHEFVTKSPIPISVLLEHLKKHDILGGYPLDEQRLLWCATEVNTKDEIDRLIALIREVMQ